MKWEQAQGLWLELRGKIKEQWGKLTDDELDKISGRRDQLLGKLRMLYGYSQQEAESELDTFLDECDADIHIAGGKEGRL